MSNARAKTPPHHKRQHREADLDQTPESQPSKRRRLRTQLHSAAFYDSLSRVWLTRRALKELDRRTSKANSPHWPASVRWHASTRWQEDRGYSWNKKIKRFARYGGPELCDLRGYPMPRDDSNTNTMKSSRHVQSSGSSKSRSTAPASHSTSKTSNTRSSAYDNDFEQHLIDNNIFPDGYDYPDGRLTPEPDMETLNGMLAQPRPSLSPSAFTASDFREFKLANARVISEGKVMSTVLPVIYGKSNMANEGDLVFTRLDPIAKDTVEDARPDFYDGVLLADVDKRVRDDIGNYIIPTGHAMAPIVPSFFLEAKPPKGAADVAKRQACYNGALGARAMHQLQSYGKDEPVYDGNAYTISTTYHAGTGTLQMYTTHPTQSSDGTAEYHMTQINTWGLTGNVNSFRQGAAAFRNARDWAQEQRSNFISVANETARAMDAEQIMSATSDNVQISVTVDQQDDTSPFPAEAVEEETRSSISLGNVLLGSPSLDPSNCSRRSSATNAQPTKESESSPDELGNDTYETASNKRRSKKSRNVVPKAPRRNDGTRWR